MAYRKVRNLQVEYQDQPDPPTRSRIELPEKDPWKRPYLLQSFSKNGQMRIRVFSEGPSSETEEDDIFYDMPNSPLLPFQQQRKQQILIATLTAGGTWLVLTAVYFVFRRARSNPKYGVPFSPPA